MSTTSSQTTAPDFGEPWRDPFSSPEASSQINIYNRHNEYVKGRALDQRKIACVNACAGMTDPAAEIEMLKLAQARALDAADLLQNAEEENAAMREAIRDAVLMIESGILNPMAHPAGKLGSLKAALGKLKPFLP